FAARSAAVVERSESTRNSRRVARGMVGALRRFRFGARGWDSSRVDRLGESPQLCGDGFHQNREAGGTEIAPGSAGYLREAEVLSPASVNPACGREHLRFAQVTGAPRGDRSLLFTA